MSYTCIFVLNIIAKIFLFFAVDTIRNRLKSVKFVVEDLFCIF